MLIGIETSYPLSAFQFENKKNNKNVNSKVLCNISVICEGFFVCLVFTPQPSGLVGYCRHGPGGRAVGRAAARLAEPISVQPLDGFSPFEVLWNCLGFSLCTVMVICPFGPYGLAHGSKTCQICHKLGPDFADCISLKPLDGCTPFKVSWTCLDL